jgi:hypothetical protein
MAALEKTLEKVEAWSSGCDDSCVASRTVGISSAPHWRPCQGTDERAGTFKCADCRDRRIRGRGFHRGTDHGCGAVDAMDSPLSTGKCASEIEGEDPI